MVELRAIRADDWEYFSQFEQSSIDARNVFRVTLPRSDATHQREILDISTNSDEASFALAIENLSERVMVGAVNVVDSDARAGWFRCGLAVASEHRRKGYATDSLKLLLSFMFGERRFHKCEVHIYAFNTASLRLHAALGFEVEGRLREREYFGGTYCDVVVMGITAAEYGARYAFLSFE
ncbi:GNAT family N-acetyltransferase [Streptomyces sp. NPDC054783]